MPQRNLLFWGTDMVLLGAGNFVPDWLPDLISWVLLIAGLLMLAYGIAGYYWRWPFAPRPWRVPLIDLREAARAKGWNFNNDSLEGMDFADGIRQAGVDGMKIWGRPNSGSGSVELLEPLVIIEPAHWADHQIDPMTLYNSERNSEILTYNPRGKSWMEGGFVDLHVDRRESARWLRREAPQFKGRHERAQKRRG